jgi:hypothetical protein
LKNKKKSSHETNELKKTYARKKKEFRYQLLLVAIFPFVLNYRLVITNLGSFLPIGNDFGYLYYVYKPYLLSKLLGGEVPLWMPQEAAGFDFALNPFTQTFYPFNALLGFVSSVNHNWTVIDQQRYTIFALSLFSVAFFLILNRIQSYRVISTIITVIMASSYKIIEILRFPNAVHAIACIAWMICAIIYLLLEQKTHKKIIWTSILIFSSASLIFAGYPYFIFYFFITIPGFIIFILSLSNLKNTNSCFQLKRLILWSSISLAITLALCLPYLVGMSEMLRTTNDRSGGNWGYSTMHIFGPIDYFGSLVLPNRASFEGWFYFGTLGVILLFTAAFAGKSINEEQKSKKLFAGLLIWTANIIFFGLAGRNPAFGYLWENFASLQSLRVWGRINILLIFPIGIALSLALQKLYKMYSTESPVTKVSRLIKIALITSIVLLAIQVLLALTTQVNSDIKTYLEPAGTIPRTPQYLIESIVIVLFLLYIYLYASSREKQALTKKEKSKFDSQIKFLIITLLIFWILQTHGFKFNGWMWTSSKASNIAAIDGRLTAVNSNETREILQDSLILNRRKVDENAGFSVLPPWGSSTIPNWHFKRYIDFLNDERIGVDLRERILGISANSRFFLIDIQKYQDLRLLTSSDLIIPSMKDTIYTGDYFSGELYLEKREMLLFADNWAPGWRAEVNGKPIEVQRIFHTFKGIELLPGKSKILFSYCPFDKSFYRIFCVNNF